MPLEFEDHNELTYGNFTDRCNYQVFLYGEAIDIGGGTITKEEIDIINEHPELDRISVAGLHQDTFDYFVNTYGHRFKAIYFFKKQNGFITGKRKPHFSDINDEKDKKKVNNAVKRFEEMKAKFRGLSFAEIVKIINKTV